MLLPIGRAEGNESIFFIPVIIVNFEVSEFRTFPIVPFALRVALSVTGATFFLILDPLKHDGLSRTDH